MHARTVLSLLLGRKTKENDSLTANRSKTATATATGKPQNLTKAQQLEAARRSIDEALDSERSGICLVQLIL